MRNEIDRNPKRLKDILDDSSMRAEFLGGAKDTRRAVKAFLEENAGNALKTRPKVSLLERFSNTRCPTLAVSVSLLQHPLGPRGVGLGGTK